MTHFGFIEIVTVFLHNLVSWGSGQLATAYFGVNIAPEPLTKSRKQAGRWFLGERVDNLTRHCFWSPLRSNSADNSVV